MSYDILFSLANGVAMLGWIGLALSPLRRDLLEGLAGGAIPILLAVAYAVLIAASWGGAEGGFGSLAEVRALFASPALLLAGWVHYLAFDLLVGAWEVREARRVGLPHLAVLPSLALTLMFGPIGLLLFLGTRAVFARRTEGLEA